MGTTPGGIHGEQEIGRWVRRMFDGVAPRYDLLNRVLSLQTDRYWRWRTARILAPVLANADAHAVDLCCGSGDLMIALARRAQCRVDGSDFSHQMLVRARAKAEAGGLAAKLFEADALSLPLAANSLDLVTAAFGFRNLANYRRGLEEMLRVLRPGGTAAILEFSTPPNAAFRAFYDVYSNRILPRIGAALSGAPDAYKYLPESVRKFPGAEALAAEMANAGFTGVRFKRMTFGIVALHTGRKP